MVENLKNQMVLSEEDVISFRQSITRQYPKADAKMRAALLADYIHQKIDQHVPKFKDQERARIRTCILKRALSSETLAIDAGDVLTVSLLLSGKQESRLETVSSWVNHRQEATVSRDTLASVVDYVNSKKTDLFHLDLDTVLQGFYKSQTPDWDTENPMLKNNPWTGSLSVPWLGQALPKMLLLSFFLFCLVLMMVWKIGLPVSSNSQAAVLPPPEEPNSPLPVELRYEDFNHGKLKTLLNKRNSLLADEPYFSAIIQTAKKHNVSPLLLFAITGQEQGFVPRSHQHARQIANNPFNVYRSWQEYNTDIHDSANIAAVTLIHLSQDRPQSADAISWINRKYSEDQNWQTGVRQILEELKTETTATDR